MIGTLQYLEHFNTWNTSILQFLREHIISVRTPVSRKYLEHSSSSQTTLILGTLLNPDLEHYLQLPLKLIITWNTTVSYNSHRDLEHYSSLEKNTSRLGTQKFPKKKHIQTWNTTVSYNSHRDLEHYSSL